MRTGGAGFKAIQKALNEMFGVTELPNVAVHGRTDKAIISDLFEKLGREGDLETSLPEFEKRYWEHLPQTLGESEGSLLPGVESLLLLLGDRKDVALGLLTGNARVPAYHKLQHFDVARYFDFGGFGDRQACRNAVAAEAVKSAANHLGNRFLPNKVWVIGDTTKDIECGRSIGARVLAVTTGGDDQEILTEAQPDLLFSDLENTTAFLEGCFGEA